MICKQFYRSNSTDSYSRDGVVRLKNIHPNSIERDVSATSTS